MILNLAKCNSLRKPSPATLAVVVASTLPVFRHHDGGAGSVSWFTGSVAILLPVLPPPGKVSPPLTPKIVLRFACRCQQIVFFDINYLKLSPNRIDS